MPFLWFCVAPLSGAAATIPIWLCCNWTAWDRAAWYWYALCSVNTTAGLSKVTVSTAPSHTCPTPFGWIDSGTDSLRKLMRVRMSKLSCRRSSRSKISTCCFFKVAKVSFSSAGFSSAGANGNFRNYRNYRFLFPLHPQKCGCPVPYGSSLDLETSVSVYDISTNGTP